jgi:glyceraldehyde 3-phosphate dehydrogenase
MRVPAINVSVVGLTFTAARATIKEEIDAAINGALKGILAVNTAPLVSIDFNYNPHSSIYDSTKTRVMEGTLVKVLSWYDNEWGFSNRMLDMTKALMAAK